MKTIGGLFSGIGGIESGFEKAGFKTLWSNENDPYSVRSFKHNYKHQLYSEDIRKLDFRKLKPVDVLVGGFPCQAFSVAGYQKGFKDPRGNLFFDICRAITELPKMPKVVMLENVKNIRGHDGGKTAKVITKSLRDLVITFAVLPPSCPLIFLTFSSITTLGIFGNSVIALQISKKRLPLGSLNPF